MEFLAYFGFLAAGLLAGWLIAARKSSSAQAECAGLRAQMAEKDLAFASKKNDLDLAQKRLEETSQASNAAQSEAAALRAQLVEIERAHVEKLKELHDAQARLAESFKALASDALHANNRQF